MLIYCVAMGQGQRKFVSIEETLKYCVCSDVYIHASLCGGFQLEDICRPAILWAYLCTLVSLEKVLVSKEVLVRREFVCDTLSVFSRYLNVSEQLSEVVLPRKG